MKELNQILAVENARNKRKKSSGEPAELGKVVRIFAIIMIIFGISIVASASYSIYKNSTKPASVTRPMIVVTQLTENEVSVRVTDDNPLAIVTYSWNDGEQIPIETNNQNTVEKTLEIPSGDGILKIYAEDIYEQPSTNISSYVLQEQIKIEVEKQDPNINIYIESQNGNELSYMTYRWDNEDEKTVDLAGEGYDAEIENIPVPQGDHTLTITVVDVSNYQEQLEQDVQGVQNAQDKPVVEIEKGEDGNFVIKASDEKGIKRVEFLINGSKKYLNYDQVFELEERKHIEYPYPLSDGQNEIIVTVYNEDGVSQEATTTIEK